MPNSSQRRRLACALSTALSTLAVPAAAQLMITGNDEKVRFADSGEAVFSAPGNDTVSVVDIGTDPMAPRIIANLPLANSVFGPPTNLAVTPDETLALVANAMDWVEEDGSWKPAPGNEVHVIDLEASPPRLIETIAVGNQPSGMAISPNGDLALVANRAGNSISVLAIDGKTVTPVGEVDMGEQVAAVAIGPDGRRALAAKFPDHKIALLEIDGTEVTYTGYDMPAGLWPYNVEISPDGRLALTADNGNAGQSDGHVDTVSVIDLEADPPRVIDRVVVGDAPEGLAISPTGAIAVAVLLKGSAGVSDDVWYANDNGSVVVLAIDGKKVSVVDEVEVGALPEGVVFSPDGRFIYVGNFVDADVSILAVDGTRVTNTGRRLTLPGHPGSMRGTP